MAVTTFDLTVNYEDGTEAQVRADQRDIAAFEQKYRVGLRRAMDEMTVGFLRYIAWAALRRTGQLDLASIESAWESWDKRVIEVADTEAADDADGAGVEDVGPGKPGALATA